MTDVATIALITAGAAATSPILLTLIQGWQSSRAKVADAGMRRAEKLEDYRRTDEVAARVEAATARQEEAARSQSGKLDAIHSMVDGSVTAEMQFRLDEAKANLALMKEIVGMNEATGRQSSPEAVGLIAAKVAQITELESALSDRVKKIDAAKLVEEKSSGPQHVVIDNPPSQPVPVQPVKQDKK